MMAPPQRQRRAMRAVLGAQFFTALADNALLIVAIGLLLERAAPAWMTPALRICLYLSYVLLAPFAGALADAWPKGRVMLITNLVKLAACLLLAFDAHPLLAFGAIGVVGVAYGPAKYAILADLVPPAQLVAANAWIEMSTVAAILGGTALGALLLAPHAALAPFGSPAHGASVAIVGIYALASLCAAAIRAIPAGAAGVAARADAPSVLACAAGFRAELALLWRDADGRIALAVTTLFWAVAAALQFLVIEWAGTVLGLTLPQSALMQCFLAVGMVAGAAGAARWVATARAMTVLPAGLALGGAIVLMTQVSSLAPACLLLFATGAVAGIVLVPMNALLQQRGAALMAPGGSIAVQSFNENLAALVFLAAYGALLAAAVPVRAIAAGCGMLVIALMLAIMRWRRAATATPVLLAGRRP
ncbi:MAG: lysophospholipid transporter LplT [Pseudomonadota bacterium]|nr:lysophospholipid transporter LplT [Pseudomonadota bacterium]